MIADSAQKQNKRKKQMAVKENHRISTTDICFLDHTGQTTVEIAIRTA